MPGFSVRQSQSAAIVTAIVTAKEKFDGWKYLFRLLDFNIDSCDVALKFFIAIS